MSLHGITCMTHLSCKMCPHVNTPNMLHDAKLFHATCLIVSTKHVCGKNGCMKHVSCNTNRRVNPLIKSNLTNLMCQTYTNYLDKDVLNGEDTDRIQQFVLPTGSRILLAKIVHMPIIQIRMLVVLSAYLDKFWY